MSTKTSTPTIRLTIPVTPEVHAVYTRMSDAMGRPAGRLMAEWLQDHLPAAEELCALVEGIRNANARASSLGLLASAYADQAQSVIDSAKQVRGAGGAPLAGETPRPVSARKAAQKVLTPPVGNTGGKVLKPPSTISSSAP
jgi:hypothetical protein